MGLGSPGRSRSHWEPLLPPRPSQGDHQDPAQGGCAQSSWADVSAPQPAASQSLQVSRSTCRAHSWQSSHAPLEPILGLSLAARAPLGGEQHKRAPRAVFPASSRSPPGQPSSAVTTPVSGSLGAMRSCWGRGQARPGRGISYTSNCAPYSPGEPGPGQGPQHKGLTASGATENSRGSWHCRPGQDAHSPCPALTPPAPYPRRVPPSCQFLPSKKPMRIRGAQKPLVPYARC